MTQQRLPKGERRAEILQAALDIAGSVGVDKVTLTDVARRVGVTHNLVLHYFKTVTQLRRDVMRAAVKQRIVPIVARGIFLRDAHALKADDALKAAARDYLARSAA
jgi:AcrR family transcriptional regulator